MDWRSIGTRSCLCYARIVWSLECQDLCRVWVNGTAQEKDRDRAETVQINNIISEWETEDTQSELCMLVLVVFFFWFCIFKKEKSSWYIRYLGT